MRGTGGALGEKMNSPRKILRQTRGLQDPREHRVIPTRLSNAAGIQPQMIAASQMRRPPAAVPVYRPHPVPKVLQTRMFASREPINQPRRAPTAPPAYRPEQKRIAQLKTAAPLHKQPNKHPKAPPVYRPQPTPKVLQRNVGPGQPTPPGPGLKKTLSERLPKTHPEARTDKTLAGQRLPNRITLDSRLKVTAATKPGSGVTFRNVGTERAVQVAIQRKTNLTDSLRTVRQVPQLRPSQIISGRPGVIQRITSKEALASFTTNQEKLDFHEWLTARDPGVGTGKGEDTQLGWALLLDDIKSVQELKIKIDLFKDRQVKAKSHSLKDETDTAAFLHNALTKSLIINYAITKLSLDEVTASLKFHSDKAFTALHLSSAQSKNAQLQPSQAWNFKIIELRKVDQVFAFEHGGEINLRQGVADLHIAIHELLHKLSAASIGDKLGPSLNEALTEYITNLVCADVKAPTSEDYYPRQRNLLAQIAKQLVLSQDDLLKIYFQNPDPLVQKLVGELGQSGCQKFLKEKDPLQASKIYKSERDENKVVSGEWYEVSSGNYAVFPNEAGKSGKALSAHVKSAMDGYQKQWHFNQSGQTRDALVKLGTMLGDFKKLFVAVGWYLFADRPKPKISVVSEKLKPNSDLWILLLSEYKTWLQI
jgi:hypothetical protein